MNVWHPGLLLAVGALAAALLRGNARKTLVVLAPAAALWCAAHLQDGSLPAYSLAGYGLEFLRVDDLSRLFALIFSLITLASAIYGLHLPDGKEQAASLVLAAASLGVVFAGDWVTLFVCWELMSAASVFLIWMGGTETARKAGYRYLLVHVLGGGLLFAGILMRAAAGETFSVSALGGELDRSGRLILLGVAINSAIPPLHAWLTDAYPECSVTGSVVQSAFTTKTAVYVLLRVFPATEVLALVGVVMALYGVVFAVLENDIRRLLSYHIVSQVGFMVAGVGLGTALSLNGAAAHAFCHILYKGLLFMGAGALIHATGRSKLTELGGAWKSLPGVCLLFMVGAFSISGLPPFNGFISKTMTIAAFGEERRVALELLLELASVGTFLSIGLKLAYHAFFGADRKLKTRPEPGRLRPEPGRLRPEPGRLRPVPANMYLGMGVAAAFCLLLGVFPGMLYGLLPFEAEYHPYTAARVASSIQLHLGTGAAFWMLLKLLAPKDSLSLDADWLYRKPFAALTGMIVKALRGLGGTVSERGIGFVYALVPSGYDVDERRTTLGASLFWIALFFAAAALFAGR